MRAAAVPADAVGPVAVLSDASDFHREPDTSALTGLLGSAALLRAHTGLMATAQLVTADNTEELITAVRQVAPDFPGGIHLVHTDPARGIAATSIRTDLDHYGCPGRIAGRRDRGPKAI